jgi:cytochrome c biogenesis factor
MVSLYTLIVAALRAPPPIPDDGRGLNPPLEDSGMITHPVALYLGFTGFTVPLAFAMAALIVGRTGDEWIIVPALGDDPGAAAHAEALEPHPGHPHLGALLRDR